MKASDIMVRKVVTTNPQSTVSEVAKLLIENDTSALPVLDGQGRLVDVISETI